MKEMDSKDAEAKTVKFLVDAPVAVEELLRQEATAQRRSRNAQLVRILEERYGLVADEAAQPSAQAEAA